MGPDAVDLDPAQLASGEGYDELNYLLHAEGKEELGLKEEPGGGGRSGTTRGSWGSSCRAWSRAPY